MSRIEEALRRTTSKRTVSVQEQEQEQVQVQPDPFESAWTFQDGRPTETADHSRPLHRPAGVEGGAVISGFNSQWKERLIVSPDAEPYLVEQFRRLAATLHQAQISNNVRKVLLTSALPGDGKTLTAINLALTLGESYKRRVLLVDADLRRPSIRDVSHLPNVMGLADALRATTEQKLTVFQLTPHLALLPAGRPDPDPMSGLTSARMRHILDDACAHYDWVIIDAPPVGTVADASIVAEMTDATLLVIRAGRTSCPLTQKAIEAVGRERILGVVLNAVEDVEATAYGYYQYQSAVVDQRLAPR